MPGEAEESELKSFLNNVCGFWDTVVDLSLTSYHLDQRLSAHFPRGKRRLPYSPMERFCENAVPRG